MTQAAQSQKHPEQTIKAVTNGKQAFSLDHFDFSPGILGVQERPPSPLPRMVLRGVLLLVLIMLLWAIFGRLDVVSVAEGKLVPISYIKIVQPSEAGIVREITIKEGQTWSIPFFYIVYSLCGNMPHCALPLSAIGFTESNRQIRCLVICR